MNEYFRGAFLYFLCFLTGCIFAAIIFGWSLHSHRIEAQNKTDDAAQNPADSNANGDSVGVENAQAILRRAFGFGVRQLAFFLALGFLSFSLMGAVIWLRAKPQESAEMRNASGMLSAPAQSTPAGGDGSASGSDSWSGSNSASATTSRLTSLRWPRAGQVVSDSSITNTSAQQIQRLVSQVDPRAQLGKSEVVMWRDATGSAADELMAATVKSLQAANWVYKITNADSGDSSSHGGVREFVAASTKEKKIVTGFWLVSDQFLLLSWGEVETPKA